MRSLLRRSAAFGIDCSAAASVSVRREPRDSSRPRSRLSRWHGPAHGRCHSRQVGPPEGRVLALGRQGDPEPEEVGQATYFAAGELTSPDPSTAEYPPLTANGVLAIDETRNGYSITTHCGLEIIFRPIDGRQWQLSDGRATGLDHVPEEWHQYVRGQEIDLVITRTTMDLLEVSALGSNSVRTYEPTAGDEIGCA